MTSPKKRSVKSVARQQIQVDKKIRDKISKSPAITHDSFVNFAQQMGIGSGGPLTTAGYGFNPITRVRTTLEWIHRGSWLGGVAVDVVADDMTRAGVDIIGQLGPEEIEKIEEEATRLSIWEKINETIKWSRLYGGCLAVLMVDGQDYKTPLRMDTVGKGQFKGLLVLDRWMVEPTLEDLIQEPGPNIGLPKYYNVTAASPALPRMKIHHSRCIRLIGTKLPYWQSVMENLWGISILERIYDRMVAFDSATTGAAQLVYKAFIRTYKVKGMREIVAAGGPALNGLVAQVKFMQQTQGNEGITLIDGEDDFMTSQHGAFAGLSDALSQFGQQLAGALQIPLVRLFGQSPSGFSSGDADLKMYYDSILQKQESELHVGLVKVYRALAQSLGIHAPTGFGVKFRSLWQLNETEKSDVAAKITDSVIKAEESGIISTQIAMRELRQSAKTTGLFSNITDEDIDRAELEPPPEPEEEPGQELPQQIHDGIGSVAAMKQYHDIDIAIENPKGSIREGGHFHGKWSVVMPADYGYIRRTEDHDGDAVDCFVGPKPESNLVTIINQIDPDTEKFDEHKVIFGYSSMIEAVRMFREAHGDGKDRTDKRLSGGIYFLAMDEFKEWLLHGNHKIPFERIAK